MLQTVVFISYTVIASLSIYISLVLGYPFKFFAPTIYRAWVDVGKQHFAVLIISLCEFFTRSRVTVYAPASIHAKLDSRRRLHTKFASRAVVMANHQLYNDWFYVWWLAYTANLHGSLIIMLKESLKRVPVFGWGMQHFEFLFMSRKWDVDQQRIQASMHNLAVHKEWPAWLLVFPEGTTLSLNGRNRTEAFAKKAGRTVPKNVLLPRVRGLEACLRGLDGSIKTMYDITMFYEGIPEGDYGEVFYSLPNIYTKNKYPRDIKFHIREFKIQDIPYSDPEEFEKWVYARWGEKDKIIDELKQNKFKDGLVTQVKLNSISELYGCFNISIALIMASLMLWNFYFR